MSCIKSEANPLGYDTGIECVVFICIPFTFKTEGVDRSTV